MKKNIRSVQVDDGTFAVVGHYISFKCDIEQSAVVTDIHSSSSVVWIVVKAPDEGFEGEYIRFSSTHEETADRCWGGLTEEELKALTAPKKAGENGD